MPEISRFYGIVIRMFHRKHAPPHLHAHCGDDEITVEIISGVAHGRFPPTAMRLVQSWLALHQDELLRCWRLAREGKRLPRIAPLE
ncbi:MAG: DUF4160 domain-containing protein [Candidatus Omnitrophota bacterium]|jgi:hypothetical protein